MSYNYWCKNRGDVESCEHCDKRGDIVIEEKDDYVCPQNQDIPLKLLGESTMFSKSISSKMTKEQIKADRRKRSSAHFKKEILPTLSTSEKIHHKLKDINKK